MNLIFMYIKVYIPLIKQNKHSSVVKINLNPKGYLTIRQRSIAN